MARLLLERKAAVLEALAPDPALQSKPYALASHSRLLDAELWLVENDADATILEAELVAERDQRPVFTVPEVERLAQMGLQDAREAGRALARVKRTIPGSRLTPSAGELLDG